MASRQEVVRRIQETPALRDELRVSLVQWRTPVVGIQNILLNTEPVKIRHDRVGAMPMSEEEYRPIYEAWKKGIIGGRKELACECVRCYWYPPKDAELFKLMCIEHDWGLRPSWTYYLLLLADGRHFFLEKRGGPDCSLKVLEEKDEALHLDDALRNVMFWEPKSPEE